MPNNFSQPFVLSSFSARKSRAAMSTQRDARQVLHYWATVVYGLIGISLFMLPVAFSNYKITYQDLLLGTNIIPMSLLIAMNISGDAYQQRRLRVVFCISLFVALAFTIYASVEPFSFLVDKCPSLQEENFEPPSHHKEEKYSQYLWNRGICQNEYGFMIVYLVYMAFIALIHIITLFVYAFRMSYL